MLLIDDGIERMKKTTTTIDTTNTTLAVATKTSFLSFIHYYAKADPPLELTLELLLHGFPHSNSLVLWIAASTVIIIMGRVSRISGLEGQGRILFPFFGESPPAAADDSRDDRSSTRQGNSEGREESTSLLERCFSSTAVERQSRSTDEAGPLLAFVLQKNATAMNNTINNTNRGRRSNNQQRRHKRSRARREGASPESAMVGRSSQATPQDCEILALHRSTSVASSVARTRDSGDVPSFFNMTSAPSAQRQQNLKPNTVHKRRETSKSATKSKRRQCAPKLDSVLEDALSDKENSFSEETGNRHGVARRAANHGSNASGKNVDGGMLGQLPSFTNANRKDNVATGNNGLMGLMGVVHTMNTERPSKRSGRDTTSQKTQINVETTTNTSALLDLQPSQKTQKTEQQPQQTDWLGLMGVVEQKSTENTTKANVLDIKSAPLQITQKVTQHQTLDGFMGFLMGVVENENAEKPAKASSQDNKPVPSQKAQKAKRPHKEPILGQEAPRTNSETQATSFSKFLPLETPAKTNETHIDESIKERTPPKIDEKQVALDKAKAKSSWLDIERKSLRKSLSSVASTEVSNEPLKSAKVVATKAQPTEATKLVKKKRPTTNSAPDVPFWALASNTVPTENEVQPSSSTTKSTLLDEPKEKVSSLLNSSMTDLSSPESTATNTNSVKITEEKQPNRKPIQSTTPVAFPGSPLSNGDLVDDSEDDNTVEKSQESDDVDLKVSPRCEAITRGDDTPDDLDITNTATTVSALAMKVEVTKPEVVKSPKSNRGRITRQSSRRNSNREVLKSLKSTKGRITRQSSRRNSNPEVVNSPKAIKGRITRQRSRRNSKILPSELQKSILELDGKAPLDSKKKKSDLSLDNKHQKKRISPRNRNSNAPKSPKNVIEPLGSSEEDSPIVIKSKKGTNGQEVLLIDSSSESESDNELAEAQVDNIASPCIRITRKARKARNSSQDQAKKCQTKKGAVARRRPEQTKSKDKQNRIANTKQQKHEKLSEDNNSAGKKKGSTDKQLPKVTRRHSNRQRSKPSLFINIFAEDAPIKTMESPNSDCEEKESPLGKRKERSVSGVPKPCPPFTDRKTSTTSTPLGVKQREEDEIEEASPISSSDEDSSSDENWNYEMSPIVLSSPELNTKPAATKSRSSTSIDSPNTQRKKPKVCFDVEEADNRPLLEDQLHPSAPIFAQIQGEGLGSKPVLKAAIVPQLKQSTKAGSHAYSNLEKAAGNTYLRMILHQPPVITAVEEKRERQHHDKLNGKSAKTGFRKPAKLVVETDAESRIPNETDEADWSSDEMNLLKTAYRKANALSRTFWADVAAQIEGRTAAGCRQKWFSLVKTPPRKVQGNKKRTFDTSQAVDNSDGDSEDENEEDTFDSSPTGDAATVSKAIHSFAGLDLGAGSPIRFNKTKLVERPIDEGDEELEVGDIREKPGYLSYIRACQKKIRLAKRQGHGKKNQAKKNNKALSKVAEHYGDGDVAVNGNLSPGGTLRVQAHYEEEDEDIVFRDDDDGESEDELL